VEGGGWPRVRGGSCLGKRTTRVFRLAGLAGLFRGLLVPRPRLKASRPKGVFAHERGWWTDATWAGWGVDKLEFFFATLLAEAAPLQIRLREVVWI